jgi:hypothetical protein
LKELELPVVIKTGILGKLSVRIPWQTLKSDPVVITIDHIFALIGPKPPAEFDAEELIEQR